MPYARYLLISRPHSSACPTPLPTLCMNTWRDICIHPSTSIPSDRNLWLHPPLDLLYVAHTALRSPHRNKKIGRWHCGTLSSFTLSLVNVQTGEELGILSIRARSALPQPPRCLQCHVWGGKGEQARSTFQGVSMENNVQFVLSCSGIYISVFTGYISYQ